MDSYPSDFFFFGRDRIPKVVTKQQESWKAGTATYTVFTHASPSEIAAFSISDGIHLFHPPEEEQQILIQSASSITGQVTLAISNDQIVGYLVIDKPDQRIRWGRAHIPSLYELEVIEVDPSHRKSGIASKMLELTFSDPLVEAWIVISLEYAWHWDLEGNHLDKPTYRQMLHNLFAKVGFVELSTDEPNIQYDPANMFMVRRGKNVPLDEWTAFERLLVQRDTPPEGLPFIGPPLQGKHKRFHLG